MHKKYGLIAVAIIIALLAIGLAPRSQQTVDQEREHPLLAPGLKEALNEIDELTVEQGEYSATVVQNDEGNWTVKELFNYPADTAKIRKLLLHISQSELRTKKTANPARLSRLGLADDQIRSITMKVDGKVKHHIRLGNIARDKINTYARLGDDPQSYVTTGRLEFQAKPHDWLFYDLFSIPRKRVKQISFRLAGKKAYDYSRTKTGEPMVLSPLPDDKELRQRIVPLSQSTYFERMVFTDIHPETNPQQEEPSYVRMTTFDGLVVTLYFHFVELHYWVQFAAQADQTADEKLEGFQSFDTTRQEAAAINRRTNGWLYELGQFQYNHFLRSYFDIVQDKKPVAE